MMLSSRWSAPAALALAALTPARVLLAQERAPTYADELARLITIGPRRGPTVQFSSYDRRSTAPGAPDWFANSDGFGREPIPGFLATIRPPDASGRGEWLVADVDGPGTIVRTWSAGMGGTLKVHLDGAATPIHAGPADEFLRAKARAFLHRAGIDLDPTGTFVQEDADYLPIPFARSLRITWEGSLAQLHFYHVTVAHAARGGRPAPTFSVDELRVHAGMLQRVHEVLRGAHDDEVSLLGGSLAGGATAEFAAGLAPGAAHEVAHGGVGIARLALRCEADDVAAALRGTLLRLRFDDASVPQVEAPVGDFFASAPGLQPHRSLFFTVAQDGWMTSRLPMPYARSCRLELHNTGAQTVTVRGRITDAGGDPSFDRAAADLGHLHAKWRVLHDVVATTVGVDVPYLTAIGRGALVGAACLLVNPSGIPTPGGSWWGEGDEKIWVDDDTFPSTFGTGSEDFFNYAWSRPDLFAHAHCGQPTCTGPGTSGYVTNFRWLMSDCVPFERSLAMAMELKHHRRTPGFSYASIAYWYALPGGHDDHRPLTARDLFVPALPRLGVVADGGAKDAVVRPVEALQPRTTASLQQIAEPLAPNHVVLGGEVMAGTEVALTLPVAEPGRYAVHLVALQRPDAAALRARIGEVPLRPAGASRGDQVAMVRPSTCVQDVAFAPIELTAGEHALVIAAASAGRLGLDTVWWKRLGPIPFRADGVLEAEALPVAAHSPGLQYEVQGLDPQRWSGGQQLFVRAERDGEFVELGLPAAPGRYAIDVQLTRSFDYGVVQLSFGGDPAGAPIDTRADDVTLAPLVTLPARDLAAGARLRLQVVGTTPQSRAPGRYFGIDWVRLRPQG